jgi:hypothetical protein
MVDWTRTTHGGLHQIDVYECPIGVLEVLARAAGVGVTVENVRPVAGTDRWFQVMLGFPPGAPGEERTLRNARCDLALSNAGFLEFIPFRDAHGVYAVFTERSPIAFQASALPESGRYRALTNFGFVMEFALAGPAGDGRSRIVTPLQELADLAEGALQGG